MNKLLSNIASGAAMCLFLFVTAFLCDCLEHAGDMDRWETAACVASDKYGLPTALLYGIRVAETGDGKYGIWSDSRRVVSRQAWTSGLPVAELESRYGRSVWWCVGRYQVLYLTAYSMGWRGSPVELGTNVEANTDYGAKILARYIEKYGESLYPYNYRNAISAYNLGHAKIDWTGHYVNRQYVDRVWGAYTNRLYR